MYDADFAHALRIIQEKSGCRVLLEPLTDKIHAISEPVKESAITEETAVEAEPVQGAKPEPPITYMTVRDFALATGCAPTTVYRHMKKGGLTGFRGEIDGRKAVNSAAMSTWKVEKASTPRKPLYCHELDKTFSSMAQTAKLLRLPFSTLAAAIQQGKTEFRGYHFTVIDDPKT